MTPAQFRGALAEVPPGERDGWVDRLLGIASPPEDGPDLPSGGVPYLPCAIDALWRLTEHAPVGPGDVFVDVGSGLGRAAIVVHLLTGATAIGVEIQRPLVTAARALADRLHLQSVSFIEGDGARLGDRLQNGTVFFLYCPFSGARLAQLLTNLAPIARQRPICVCCVDLPLPACEWLTPMPPMWPDLVIYRGAPHT